MKYFLLLAILTRCTFGQTINIDSLERHGYHVYVHKQHHKPRVIIRQITLHDTVWRDRTVVLHDTLRVFAYVERRVTPEYVLLQAPMQGSLAEALTIALVGTANTNGYELHAGATLGLGKRIKFFVGAGCAYNSVLKETRLDLGGHLMIVIAGGE